ISLLTFSTIVAAISVVEPRRLSIALIVTLAFAIGARIVKGVTWSGAVAGAVIAFILYAGAGPGAFLSLIALFAITSLATRLGYARKQRSGPAERTDGRNAWQFLANLSVAAIFVILFDLTSNNAFIVAFAAALAEAATDTVSSECGQALSDRA